MALTQECVLSFLLERGGRAKNSELLSNFRSHISCGDPAERQRNRELFKRLVNSVAVVRQVGEVKFVVVKRRYQDFAKDAAAHDGSFCSADGSFSCAEPDKPLHPDVENNNVCFPAHMNCSCCCDAVGGRLEGAETTVKVLNLSGEQVSRAGRSGAVFAVVAVKSPPRAKDGLHTQSPPRAAAAAPQLPPREEDAKSSWKAEEEDPRTLSFPQARPQNAVKSPPRAKDGLHTQSPPRAAATAPPDPQLPPREEDAKSSWKAEESDPRTLSFPQARPQNRSARPGEEAKPSESVPLEPLAHEWLVKCAAGLWGQIHALLLRDPRLAHKRDFMSGFTALHWAAKDGNTRMIQELVDVPGARGAGVNVNAKAHGGYTPLHIAAIHGRSEAAVLLVRRHGANVDERDNDGKKAFRYLGKGASAEARALLGGLRQRDGERPPDEDEGREHSKGFNSISKLFQPHIGKRQKHAAKFTHDW